MNQTKRVTLYEDQDLQSTVTWYAPHLRMKTHAHGVHQFSFLLAGGLTEETARDTKTCEVPSRGIKCAGQVHANRYGPHGALILTANLNPEAAEPIHQPPWRWEHMTAPKDCAAFGAPLLKSLWLSPQEERRDIIWDLIAHQFSEEDRAPEDACPRWLKRVLEELHESPESADLGGLAVKHGIHRGHLSRAFKRRFGVSPSQYRARIKVMRGITRLMQGQRPAQAALGAGFADQSHFSRVVSRYLGVTPGSLKGFLHAAS